MKLIDSGRVPSYKALALAILRNDHHLYSLGFSQRPSKILDGFIMADRIGRDPQMDFFR
jgi:predicted phosphoadenosine phosphosulfate sulfurtransferase